MTILIMNGPNLSQLGRRDPATYGGQTLDDVIAGAKEEHADLEAFQSDHEGDLVVRLHGVPADGTQAVVVNPGALTHYSYALRDALEMVEVPKVEVHLSQIAAREEFRHHSVISAVVDVTISGAGGFGYKLAVQAALHLIDMRR